MGKRRQITIQKNHCCFEAFCKGKHPFPRQSFEQKATGILPSPSMPQDRDLCEGSGADYSSRKKQDLESLHAASCRTWRVPGGSGLLAPPCGCEVSLQPLSKAGEQRFAVTTAGVPFCKQRALWAPRAPLGETPPVSTPPLRPRPEVHSPGSERGTVSFCP